MVDSLSKPQFQRQLATSFKPTMLHNQIGMNAVKRVKSYEVPSLDDFLKLQYAEILFDAVERNRRNRRRNIDKMLLRRRRLNDGF
jgi:hypothetical protein